MGRWLSLCLIIGTLIIVAGCAQDNTKLVGNQMDLVERLIQIADSGQVSEFGLQTFQSIIPENSEFLSEPSAGSPGKKVLLPEDLEGFAKNLSWNGPDKLGWYMVTGTSSDNLVYSMKIRNMEAVKTIEFSFNVTGNNRVVNAFFHDVQDGSSFWTGTGSVEIRKDHSTYKLDMTFSGLNPDNDCCGTFTFNSKINDIPFANVTASYNASRVPTPIYVEGWYKDSNAEKVNIKGWYPLFANQNTPKNEPKAL